MEAEAFSWVASLGREELADQQTSRPDTMGQYCVSGQELAIQNDLQGNPLQLLVQKRKELDLCPEM